MSLVDLIFAAMFGLLGGVLSLIPEYELPSSVLSAFEGFGSALGGMNGVVPVGTLGAALVAVVGFRLFLLVWDLVVFVYGKIPLKFT